MTDLHVQVWGEGVPAVLVHGSVAAGEESWEAQRPLADDGFQLLVPRRRAYGDAAGDVGEDFLEDAEDVVELLGDGAHLVGHSYGGVSALLAAARRPDAVLSLAVIEPPAFGLRPDDPAVASLVADVKRLLAQGDLSDRAFLDAFMHKVGAPTEGVPEEVIEHWATQVGPLRRSRPPWEAEIPLDQLNGTPFPKLVVSGGHHPAFDAICDEVARGLGVECEVITGAAHVVQMVGEPFNQALLDLWRRA